MDNGEFDFEKTLLQSRLDEVKNNLNLRESLIDTLSRQNKRLNDKIKKQDIIIAEAAEKYTDLWNMYQNLKNA